MPVYRNLNLLNAGVLIRSGPGRISYLDAVSPTANVRYVKLYDKATAPVVGTDVPVWTVLVPAAGRAAQLMVGSGGGLLSFQNGIGIAATTLSGDADATSPAANEVFVNIIYS